MLLFVKLTATLHLFCVYGTNLCRSLKKTSQNFTSVPIFFLSWRRNTVPPKNLQRWDDAHPQKSIWSLFLWSCSSFYFAGCIKLTIQCQHRSCQTTTPNGGCFLCRGAHASGLRQLLYSLLHGLMLSQCWSRLQKIYGTFDNNVFLCNFNFKNTTLFSKGATAILVYLLHPLSVWRIFLNTFVDSLYFIIISSFSGWNSSTPCRCFNTKSRVPIYQRVCGFLLG
jgi:hypothetical protein